MSQESKVKILKERSLMLNKVRSFFIQKDFIEIDPPHITKRASIDEYIDPMRTHVNQNDLGFLHTSPEYIMKRLLALNLDKIFFLGHVFRKDELGKIHNPEFTMIEWYRKNVDFDFFINETLDLINLFIGKAPIKKMSYKNLILEFTNLNYTKAKISDYKKILKNFDVSIADNIDNADDFLNLIMTHIIEPKMKKNLIYIIYDYPKSQAALAKTHIKDNCEVAERFEIYFNKIELANGFHELNCAKEQKKRFLEINKKRKEKFLLDEKFLSALTQGIGNCYGIAVGFDRLFMLQQNKKSIKDILCYSWEKI